MLPEGNAEPLPGNKSATVGGPAGGCVVTIAGCTVVVPPPYGVVDEHPAIRTKIPIIMNSIEHCIILDMCGN